MHKRQILTAITLALPLVAQMVSPDIDRDDQPFSYFSNPTDVIGVMDAQAATEVTPEGYLYTGFGELMFFTGAQDRPTAQRIKTLRKGYLPIIEYSLLREGIAYEWTMFAATLDGKPEGPLVNFIRVTIRNTNAEPMVAYFSTGVRYQNQVNTSTGIGDNRFRRPALLTRPGDFQQIGEEWNAQWVYGFDGDRFVRDHRVLYVFPPDASLRLTLRENYNRVASLAPRGLNVLPDTPTGIAQYRLPLAPGQVRSLDFKMPYVPMTPGSADLATLEAARFDDYLARTERFWEAVLSRGMRLEVPESKVVETFKTSLINDLLARDKIGDLYIQTVNKFQYHRFYYRDAADITRMYDLTGYADIARQVLDFFGERQQPDGNFVSQPGQLDGWGEALYAYGLHYRITGDRDFAERVYPSVKKAFGWIQKVRASDPLHLIPATTIGDNEDVPGHLTGHNFLALAGLKNAILLAKALGNSSDVATFTREFEDYRTTLLTILRKATATTGGYIPPALDGQAGGQDWGNLLALTPEPILDPEDPMVAATLKHTQAKYQEGIMTYGDGRWLHHYLTIKNTFTEVIRGDQEQAVRELYALLLHTSSTHAGFEYAIRPWGTRDFGANLAPHGWFAAEYRTLLRNMLVREQGNDLHLLSVVSPEWIATGREVMIGNAPTEFGQVNLRLQVLSDTRAHISLDNHFTRAPDRVVLHLPWFLEVSRAEVDGRPVTTDGGLVQLPSGAKEVVLHWKMRIGVPPLSYAQTLRDYKSEYRRKHAAMLRTGYAQ